MKPVYYLFIGGALLLLAGVLSNISPLLVLGIILLLVGGVVFAMSTRLLSPDTKAREQAASTQEEPQPEKVTEPVPQVEKPHALVLEEGILADTKTPSIILGKSKETGAAIPLSQEARRQGTYMVGVTGTGKSTLLTNLIAQDMEQGLGLCLLDPHGDLTTEVLSRIPDNRIEDVILLDLMDSEYPFGLNLFDCPNNEDAKEVATTAGFVMHVFEKVWGVGTETPQLSQVLRNVAVTLIANPGTTFNEIPLLLQNETVRGKLIGNVTNNQVKLFWTTYGKLRPVDQMERTSSTLNKVDAFLTQPIIANIVGQGTTTIDFRKIMDSGKILLVKLTPQLEDISSLVGAVVIGQLLNAALSRKDVPEDQRRQFNLYADEYQRFATSDFATLLSEARKFGIATTISHQTRSQLDFSNKGSSLNAGTKIIFRVSGEDGKELAREFDHTPTTIKIGDEPVRAPVQDVVKHLLDKGHTDPEVSSFVSRYLAPFVELSKGQKQAFATSPYEAGALGAKTVYLPGARVDQSYLIQSLEDINLCFGTAQRTHDPETPLKPLAFILLALAAKCAAPLSPYYKISYPETNFSLRGKAENLAFLGTADFARKVEQDFTAGKLAGAQAAAFVQYVHLLRRVIAILAQEPIMVDTGQYKPKYQQRTYADMEGEIASTLTNLPNFEAKVKTVTGEATIKTIPKTMGLTGREFAVLHERVISQTRMVYCRPAAEVEQEITDRQAVLMQEEERLQGRREDVEAGKQDGQGQGNGQAQFRPSRRHKEPQN